jgi:DNA-binding response OmpR family regulator
MTDNPHIFIVDDEAAAREMVGDYLKMHGYRVTLCDGGASLRKCLKQGDPDLIVLDLNMPEEDGLSIVRDLKSRGAVPVIMLTATASAIDRVVGLELGADDYIAKPFGPRELVARLRAVLRRANPQAEADFLMVNDISIDVPGHKVKVRGQDVEVTGIEFDILVALARRAGRVVAREALLTEAGRGDVSVGDRTVDVHISHLRQKLGDDPRSPKTIKTIRGVGYVLVKDTA